MVCSPRAPATRGLGGSARRARVPPRAWDRERDAAAGVRHVRVSGLTRAMVNVDAENVTGATGVYERVGMRVVGRWDMWERLGQPAGEAPAGAHASAAQSRHARPAAPAPAADDGCHGCRAAGPGAAGAGARVALPGALEPDRSVRPRGSGRGVREPVGGEGIVDPTDVACGGLGRLARDVRRARVEPPGVEGLRRPVHVGWGRCRGGRRLPSRPCARAAPAQVRRAGPGADRGTVRRGRPPGLVGDAAVRAAAARAHGPSVVVRPAGRVRRGARTAPSPGSSRVGAVAPPAVPPGVRSGDGRGLRAVHDPPDARDPAGVGGVAGRGRDQARRRPGTLDPVRCGGRPHPVGRRGRASAAARDVGQRPPRVRGSEPRGAGAVPSAVFRRNGDVLPTLLVDGEVAGVWRPVDGAIEATAFRRLDDAAWEGLAKEARGLLRFLGSREPEVYRRYGHWWGKDMPRHEVRLLPG